MGLEAQKRRKVFLSIPPLFFFSPFCGELKTIDGRRESFARFCRRVLQTNQNENGLDRDYSSGPRRDREFFLFDPATLTRRPIQREFALPPHPLAHIYVVRHPYPF